MTEAQNAIPWLTGMIKELSEDYDNYKFNKQTRLMKINALSLAIERLEQ